MNAIAIALQKSVCKIIWLQKLLQPTVHTDNTGDHSFKSGGVALFFANGTIHL